jgi:hypothetical protein
MYVLWIFQTLSQKERSQLTPPMTVLNQKSKKLSERIQAMKKQEAVRQEFRKGAEAVKSLPAWMQRIEEKGRQSAVKPSGQETKQRETPSPTMEALAGPASNQSE